MKEVEIFTPLSLVFAAGSMPAWEIGLTIALVLVILTVPLANRRRQRLGDIIAGTLVVDNPRSVLLSDLAISAPTTVSLQVEFDFLPEHLDVYGKYELQTLEDVLRDPTKSSNNEEIELYEANLAFHRDLLALSGNQELVDLVTEIRQRTSSAPVSQWRTRARIEQSDREHHMMIDAIEKRAPADFKRLVELHIRQP